MISSSSFFKRVLPPVLLAVLAFSVMPVPARAATIKPSDINIGISTAGGQLPIYKYVVTDQSNQNIHLKITLNNPELLRDGDTLAVSKNPTIKGVYLGLSGDPTFGNCGTSRLYGYTSCSYEFDNGNPEKGFRTISSLTKERAVNYPITLSFDDLAALGVPVQNPRGGYKDIYFQAVVNLAGSGLQVTAFDFSVFGSSFTARVYTFGSQAEADAAGVNTTGLSSGTTGGGAVGATAIQSGNPILTVINIILGVVLGLLRWIVWMLGLIALNLLEKTLSMEASGISGGPVLAGWQFVRDVVNMLFILVLIAIGLGTILKLESYNYKKLLVNLIVMALLVNFSLVIGRIILQIADVAQFNFLPAGDLPGQPAGTTGVRYIFQKLSTVHVLSVIDGFRAAAVESATTVTFALILQFIFELGVILTFAALAIFMVIRTLGIWILLIISPLAYALAILPTTAGLASKWWSSYIKYVLFAPILAFFIRLTLELYSKGLNIFQGSEASWFSRTDLISELNRVAQSGQVNFAQGLELILIFVMVLGFLWAGMIVSKQMGIAGAGAIVGLAERGLKAPLGGAWKGTKFGLGALDRYLAKGATEGGRVRRAFSYLSVGAWKRGWGIRRKEEEERAFGVSAGKRADTFYKAIRRPTKWGKPVSTAFGLEAHQGEVLRRAKQKMDLNLSEREMVEEALHAENTIDKQGWGMAIAALNRQDDFQRILKEMKDSGELKKLHLPESFKNPLTGQVEKLEDLIDGQIDPTKFQKLFYGFYLKELGEKERMGYASMIQEFGEKNVKPYHLADTIEVEETDAQGRKHVKRVVNYGYANLRQEAVDIREKQANNQPLTPDEEKKLAYFNAVAGQFKSRMNRTGANRFLNALRAADIDIQFADSATAQAAGFAGEDYGDMHDQGMIVTELLGVPHATHLRNRKHELQLRGVIPFGAKGEEIAPEPFSLARASSAAAVNPPVMKIFIERDVSIPDQIKIFEEALNKAPQLKVPKENIQKINEILTELRSKAGTP